MASENNTDWLVMGHPTSSAYSVDQDLLDQETRFFPYPKSAIKSVPTWQVVVKVSAYSPVIVMSLLGNLCVVSIVLLNRRMWATTTNLYIVSLALSDLMVTVSCPWVHLVDDLTEGWPLGAFFCKFNSFAQVTSLVSSVLTLTLISCDRFFGIVFAMKAHVSERRPAVFIVVIWVVALGVSSPLLVYREQFTRLWLNHTEVWCGDAWPVYELPPHPPDYPYPRVSHLPRQVYYTSVSILLYFIPVVVMSVTCSFVSHKLWSNNIPGERVRSNSTAQERSRRKVVKMLVPLVIVFGVCWLPFQVSLLFNEYRRNRHLSLPTWYPIFQFSANFLAFTNSALNPIIYTAFNNNFRIGFKKLLRCIFCRRVKKRYSVVSTTIDQGTVAVPSNSLPYNLCLITLVEP